MDIHYEKNDNTKVFLYLANSNEMGIENMQNYIPIYDRFFALTKNNYNTINLNHSKKLLDISAIISSNTCTSSLIDMCHNVTVTDIFFKFSPLIDPIKYMVGKYDTSDTNLFNIPSFNSTTTHKKTLDKNNSSYTDGFFSYLSSKLLHEHQFIHATDFYGAFLGNKKDFYVNIYDELDYLQESRFFSQNKDKLFQLDNKYYDDYFDCYTRNHKQKLSIKDVILNKGCCKKTEANIIDLKDVSNIHDISFIDKLFISPRESVDESLPILMYHNEMSNNNISQNIINEKKPCSKSQLSSSSCSSRSSNTNSSSSSGESDESDESSISSYSTASEDTIHAKITNFPVEIIALEKCDNTLDHHILHGDISDKELSSIILQILMILNTFQKVFHMTHNDLHTNNIMYISTKKEFLYYKFNKKYYKVPTFGKIYKIIDFGRAIYHFKGQRICSDSFHKDGDGATQYNCEPYYNDKKPTIEPNYSFDLCRLGCSMFDFLVEDLDDVSIIKSPIKNIIINWCKDDASKNVLYKSSGKERYPDFKLYKMITRTVHDHVPSKVITNEHFTIYIIPKKKITKNKPIMNIDQYPDYAV